MNRELLAQLRTPCLDTAAPGSAFCCFSNQDNLETPPHASSSPHCRYSTGASPTLSGVLCKHSSQRHLNLPAVLCDSIGPWQRNTAKRPALHSTAGHVIPSPRHREGRSTRTVDELNLSSFLNPPPSYQVSVAMTLKLYANLISQPSRAVAWVLKVKGVDHELVPVTPGSDFFKSDEFKAINPNRLVPAIKDGDFVLTEGMAILQYLGDKYDWTGPKDLYPKDLQVRAKVNEFLHWHHTNTRLFTINIVRPEISKKLNAATPNDVLLLEGKDALVEKEFSLLETFLVKDYIAHTDFPTIADYTAYTEIDQLELMGYDFSKYPKVSAWIARMKTQPFNEEIHVPLIGFLKQFGL
ncbi:unnamed protein product [Phytophthora fragariaefolia]|uniref:Unnamed protein product n=1 Tax=Phytophthora fragariaefolia TaxID=1490495 RepID=A0A9W6TYL4_9STRA|nr:unnamed protein product [Phytophthora fragariaefolia]